MSNPSICTQEDEFVLEKPHWIAHLSNGEKVYQDDGREGVEPQAAWLRLREYCRQTNISVVDLALRFRSHYEAPLPKNRDGYFFVNKAVRWSGSDTFSFMLIGCVDELQEKVFVQTWKVPELYKVGEEYRTFENTYETLIRN